MKATHIAIAALSVFIIASFFLMPKAQIAQKKAVLSDFDAGILSSGRLNQSLLKAQHIHADFAVFANGKQVDFRKSEYYGRSAFLHIEPDDDGSTGKKLHMHSTNVPLWVFFESIGMEFGRQCLVAETKDCGNVMLFVNGTQNNGYEDYVFGNGDRILITVNPKEIEGEKASLTSYSQKE